MHASPPPSRPVPPSPAGGFMLHSVRATHRAHSMIRPLHCTVLFGLALILTGCGNAVSDPDMIAAKPLDSLHEIDGWKLGHVSPNDPMSRVLTKDGNELTILYSNNPTKNALDIFNEIIPAIKSRGAESIELTDMSGYLEVTQLKPKDSTFPSLVVGATLMGPSEVLQIGFKGEGDRDHHSHQW